MTRSSPATVSVIVPTRNRPEQLRDAIESIFAQTLAATEIIVIVDGADDHATIAELETLAARHRAETTTLEWIVQRERRGPAAARNRGMDAAIGEWIAFLDDDDVWFPDKLERQVVRCQSSDAALVIGAHAVLRRSPSGAETVMADRQPAAGEPLAEFLFCRARLGGKKGHLFTPTLLLNRAAADSARFDEDLRVHEDWDLLLRLEALGARVVYLATPLAQWTVRSDAQPYSQGATVHDWRFELEWARERRDLLGERGFSGFCLSIAGDQARADRSARGWLRVLRTAAEGSMSPGDAFTYFGTLLPERVRDRLARRFG